MEYSAEIRWFFNDSMPEIGAWFDHNHNCISEDPPRTDFYLNADALLTHGIKIRDGKLEVKIQQQDLGQISLLNNNAGRGNMWCKYSFALEKGDHEARLITEAFMGLRPEARNKEWIRLDKKRRQIKYLAEPEKSLVSKVNAGKTPEQGCNVELTRVSINHGREFSTFGFEAYGKEGDVRKNLGLALTQVFPELTVTGLGVEHSFSYPEFIFKGRNTM